MMKKKKGVSAWLILWDSPNKNKIPKDKIAAILSPRLSSKKIAFLIEILYANSFYTYSERIDFATRKWNPYPAQFSGLAGEISCGNNPYLEAFPVDDLKTITNKNGKEEIIFIKRRPRPKTIKNL